MPRRQESIGDILVKAHWGVSAALAVIAYCGLKWIVPLLVADTENVIFKSFGPGVAGLAPYAFGFLCIISAISFFFGLKRRRLVDTQTSLSSLNEISWKEFEWMVAEAFKRRGYSVEDSLNGGPDGGVDLVLRGKSGKTLVQCKQWKRTSIGVPVIRELYGVMTSEGADAGIVVSSGHFTREAWEFASGKPIELIDGKALIRLIKAVQASGGMPVVESVTPIDLSPDCPDCGSKMILRTARKGLNAGSSFWGCPSFPNCRGTRPK
jgi:restriction system protein